MSNRFGPLADEGEEVECALRAGGNFRKAPVVDSGASRHFFGRDVSSYVVKVRGEEREFLGVEGGISRSSKDVTVELPGVETVDGGEETARLDGSFSHATIMSPDSFVFSSEAARSISPISVGDRVMVTDPRPLPSSGLPVHGKEGIFCGVESESCVMVIVKTENGRGWKPLRMHPSGVSLIEWYGLNAFPDLTEFEGATAAPADDVDRFSDFSFDDDGEVDANAMGGADPVAVLSSSRAQATFFDSVSTAAIRQLEHVVRSQPASVSAPFSLPSQGAAGSHLPAGQLEARAQQQGVESKREDAKQSERDAAPAAESEETEREEEIVLPDIPDDDSLFGANLLKSDSGTAAAGLLARESGPTSSREEKGVQVAQEDEGVQEAQDDRRKREKEKKEKKKRVTRLSVDKKVIDVMMAQVNPRKGHVMATEEEVRNGSHDGAMREELKSFQRNEVLKVGGVRIPTKRRVMKTRWVLTWKMKGGERVPKARLVCKGFQDDRKNVETYSGMAAWWALLVCFVFALSKGWKIGKLDVHTAFLTASISDVVFVQLPGRVPKGSPERFASGEVSQLLRAIYGLKDTPRLYGQHFKRIARECGWEEVIESVFVKKEAGSVKAVMAVHVDDLLVFSDDPVRDLEPLRKRLEMDEPEILECGGEMGYTGMEVKRTEEGFALLQKAYLESIPVQKENLLRKSLSPKLIESSTKEETDKSLFSGVDDPKLVLFVDAAYSLSRCEGRGGFEAYLVDKKESIANVRFSNLVVWKSKRIKRKLISSTSAELCALIDGVKQSFQWKQLAEALWMKPLEVEVYTDSAPLMEQLESGQSRREPHMDGLLAYARQELRALKAKVLWV
uniref:RNase H type-1 domain-containing protein n=1 Tax=Chromera velia CCMP2878 TaxID=1169474 RepID=A0A0G4I103_9ALVE|eukprot:Cvel_1654.t1-p1 / transcript=Cvel_1654.t1 / gene=Cvel_1654 / organism=Chromera_velia_CCMP2878 / gene_product=Retrovirus-related Pol polyprotein from transposon, putative / transcript_product=Retrovirus-related Pol polyprotein from transposon, putative / location=Cvel_scaffold59:117643-121379(+) / protein_length=846 / sequence_SO=supercontig / SO=protein_coding / is_pseudo=false